MGIDMRPFARKPILLSFLCTVGTLLAVSTRVGAEPAPGDCSDDAGVGVQRLAALFFAFPGLRSAQQRDSDESSDDQPRTVPAQTEFAAIIDPRTGIENVTAFVLAIRRPHVANDLEADNGPVPAVAGAG